MCFSTYNVDPLMPLLIRIYFPNIFLKYFKRTLGKKTQINLSIHIKIDKVLLFVFTGPFFCEEIKQCNVRVCVYVCVSRVI